jgi:hypothetical protein
VVFLLFALTLVPAVFNRFEPSRRARLATDSTMIFGGILGMMFALVAFVSIYFTGVPSLTWLLFPLGYIANRWLHKKPLLARRRVAP